MYSNESCAKNGKDQKRFFFSSGYQIGEAVNIIALLSVFCFNLATPLSQ